MKASELKQIIRLLIKEEFKSLIKEEVAEQINKSMARLLAEVISNKKEIIVPENKPNNKPIEPKRYTNNSILNEILNETISDIPQEKGLVGLDGDFEKIGVVQEPIAKKIPTFNPKAANKIEMLKEIVEPTKPTYSVTEDQSNVPNVLKGVFNKDYRKLMKTIDEKKKSGIINTGAVTLQ